MLSVVPGEVVAGPACRCCDRMGRSAFGFVHRDGEAIAFYHAWLDPHRDPRAVSLAISLGDWGPDGDVAGRRTAALRLESVKGEVTVSFIDPRDLPFREPDRTGWMLSVDEVRFSVLVGELLDVAEAILLEDPEVNSRLAS